MYKLFLSIIIVSSIITSCASNSGNNSTYADYVESKRNQNIGICKDSGSFVALATVARQESLDLEGILHSNDPLIKKDLAKLGCFNVKINDFLKNNPNPVPYSRVAIMKNASSLIHIEYLGLSKTKESGYISEKDFLSLIVFYL